jgi:hypothetical protein
MTPRYSAHAPGKYRKRMDPNVDQYFRIDSGRYKGVCFTFGDIRVAEEKEIVKSPKRKSRTVNPVAAKIDFDFDIIHSPMKRVKREPFLACLSEILEKELLKVTTDVNVEDIVVGDTPELSDTPITFADHEIIP